MIANDNPLLTEKFKMFKQKNIITVLMKLIVSIMLA